VLEVKMKTPKILKKNKELIQEDIKTVNNNLEETYQNIGGNSFDVKNEELSKSINKLTEYDLESINISIEEWKKQIEEFEEAFNVKLTEIEQLKQEYVKLFKGLTNIEEISTFKENSDETVKNINIQLEEYRKTIKQIESVLNACENKDECKQQIESYMSEIKIDDNINILKQVISDTKHQINETYLNLKSQLKEQYNKYYSIYTEYYFLIDIINTINTKLRKEKVIKKEPLQEIKYIKNIIFKTKIDDTNINVNIITIKEYIRQITVYNTELEKSKVNQDDFEGLFNQFIKQIDMASLLRENNNYIDKKDITTDEINVILKQIETNIDKITLFIQSIEDVKNQFKIAIEKSNEQNKQDIENNENVYKLFLRKLDKYFDKYQNKEITKFKFDTFSLIQETINTISGGDIKFSFIDKLKEFYRKCLNKLTEIAIVLKQFEVIKFFFNRKKEEKEQLIIQKRKEIEEKRKKEYEETKKKLTDKYTDYLKLLKALLENKNSLDKTYNIIRDNNILINPNLHQKYNEIQIPQYEIKDNIITSSEPETVFISSNINECYSDQIDDETKQKCETYIKQMETQIEEYTKINTTIIGLITALITAIITFINNNIEQYNHYYNFNKDKIKYIDTYNNTVFDNYNQEISNKRIEIIQYLDLIKVIINNILIIDETP